LPRYAIGDVQGCLEPLQELLRKLRFSADRDELLFVGDLVNRGPDSLGVLRLVRAMQGNARCVLGNHDLHLLAHHYDNRRPLRDGDTLQEVLAAPDRDALMDWMIQWPLIIDDTRHGNLLLHAGLIPEWSIPQALQAANEATAALRADARGFLSRMYGNEPTRWRDAQGSTERHRFTINALTRLRFCAADGTVNLKLKGAPHKASPPWKPWFEHASRREPDIRVVFGHWSTLGLLQRRDVLALDSGCVWGGTLTAVDLDDPDAPAMQVKCRACQLPDGE
jgi:bis(5'-nucleosyl)-tetraphosphatase (symmetrical)